MTMLHFSNGDSEYIAFCGDDVLIKDYTRPGYRLVSETNHIEEPIGFPIDTFFVPKE